MKAPVAAFAMLAFIPVAAVAQQDPDIAALTKTVQALSKKLDRADQRFDRLQKQIDQLRSGASMTTTAAPAPTALQTPAPIAPAGSQMVPLRGWKVDVIPIEDEHKDPVANFAWDKPEFSFAAHTKKVSGHNLYLYRGIGYFHPDQRARYVFQLNMMPLKPNVGWQEFRCRGNIKIKDEVIVQGEASAAGAHGDYDKNGNIFVPTTFSGGSELEPSANPAENKDYQVTFQVGCYYGNNHETQLGDALYAHWLEDRFSITVKGPDDDQGREFAGNELYHYGKLKPGK